MTTERRIAAAKMLTRVSCLALNPHVAKHVDLDSNRVDWEALAEWRWSSGETVLVELMRVLLLGHGTARIEDLQKLDEDNRAAAIAAIQIGLGAEPAAIY